MVVVARSFHYDGCCEVISLRRYTVVVVRSFYGMCPVMVARLYYGTYLLVVRSYYNQTL